MGFWGYCYYPGKLDNLLVLAILPVPIVVNETSSFQAQSAETAPLPPQINGVANVPFFSQFKDIQLSEWQEVGCGITSLAMMIDFYKPEAVSVDALLQQGIAAGAYDPVRGWTTAGLISLSERYGLTGNYYDFSKLSNKTALGKFKALLTNGPVILSVHNRFNPKSSVPHLVVIDGIEDNVAYYNDPAAKTGEKSISVTNLLKGWKKKGIAIRPTPPAVVALR